jgi:hypothetical protein
MVNLALVDNAFNAPSLTSAEKIFNHKVWGPVSCTPLHWKPEMLKIPLFRHYEQTVDGVITSPNKPLLYSHFRDCLNQLGRATGFKDKLISYCFRRGTANAINGRHPLTFVQDRY